MGGGDRVRDVNLLANADIIPSFSWEEYHTGENDVWAKGQLVFLNPHFPHYIGTLFLSAFSVPVEGILMICGIYLITGFATPSLWSTRVIDLVPAFVAAFDRRAKLLGGQDREETLSFVDLGAIFHKWLDGFRVMGGAEGLTLSEAFLCFGALGLIANVAHR